MKYKILTILILGLLIVSSCSTKHVSAPDKYDYDQETIASMMEALEGFISNTPYCALIQYTSVEVVPVHDPYPEDDYVEEKHIYHAKVLETFRGQQLNHINYVSISEEGDGARISAEPVVITLCVDKESFFWPGTGSVYPASEKVIKAARRISKKVKSNKQSFSFCE